MDRACKRTIMHAWGTMGQWQPAAGTAAFISSHSLQLTALMHVQWICDERRALDPAAACCLPFEPYI